MYESSGQYVNGYTNPRKQGVNYYDYDALQNQLQEKNSDDVNGHEIDIHNDDLHTTYNSDIGIGEIGGLGGASLLGAIFLGWLGLKGIDDMVR